MVLKARANFDCKADDDRELSFKEKAIFVDIVEASDEGWFEGTLEDSKIRGLFPGNYVEFFEEEKQLKLPPKPPPRKTSDNSMPSFNKKLSDDPVNSSDKADISLPEPKKLSAAKFAIFEQSNNNNNNSNNNIKPSQKSPPIIKPKPIVSQNSEISSRSIRSNSDEQEHEVTTPPISVGKIKSLLERNTKEPTTLPLKTPIKPITSLKPTNTPPPIAPKPGKLAPPLPSKPSSTGPATDKKPPLPPRRPSNSPSINSSNDVPPPTPPRPSSNGLVSNSYLTKNIDTATTKARTGAQDAAGEAAKQGVSAGISQLKGDLSRSKYGNKKIPGQNALFDKAEKHAQDIASDQAKKKVGETYDENLKNIRSKSTSKPILPIRNNSILSNINNQMSRPQLPERNTDIKIPRRPTSHNPFSENDLSKGISPKIKKRYEIIYDANKDNDDYIDGAVVKAIYLKSRLDNNTLSKIWNLLDVDKDGRLSRNEFCAGMFLIDERLSGHPIPDELPCELLE